MRRVLRGIIHGVFVLTLCGLAAVDYGFRVWRVARIHKSRARAEWLHRWCGAALDALRVRITWAGPLPSGGLLVANHLSYLDIMVLSATLPCAFVSKEEVRRWPLFGWLAARGGTIFVRRERRTDVGRVNAEIKSRLEEGVTLVLFPEGTSTDGSRVLPFRTPLLEPALALEKPVTATHLSYGLQEGDPAREVCYCGDMVFFPHLINLLTRRGISAHIRFTAPMAGWRDRREAAVALHAAVASLHNDRVIFRG